MKYSKFLTYLLAFSSAMVVNQCTAMENATNKIDPKTYIVEDFDENRDMDSVTEIYKRDWERLYIGKPFNLDTVKLLLAKDTIASATKKWRKVLRHGDKTVGFATYYFFNDRKPKNGYLETGGLDAALRNQGIGSHYFPLMLKELEDFGSQILEVFVKKDNIAAHKIYKKYGFAIFGHAFNNAGYKLVKDLRAISTEGMRNQEVIDNNKKRIIDLISSDVQVYEPEILASIKRDK
jgi:ribosomal protein S18 acetylase RimI-like enzyme